MYQKERDSWKRSNLKRQRKSINSGYYHGRTPEETRWLILLCKVTWLVKGYPDYEICWHLERGLTMLKGCSLRLELSTGEWTLKGKQGEVSKGTSLGERKLIDILWLEKHSEFPAGRLVANCANKNCLNPDHRIVRVGKYGNGETTTFLHPDSTSEDPG